MTQELTKTTQELIKMVNLVTRNKTLQSIIDKGGLLEMLTNSGTSDNL